MAMRRRGLIRPVEAEVMEGLFEGERKLGQEGWERMVWERVRMWWYVGRRLGVVVLWVEGEREGKEVWRVMVRAEERIARWRVGR